MADNYKLVTSFRLFEADILSAKEVEVAVARMKGLLVHAVLRTGKQLDVGDAGGGLLS